MVPTGLYKHYKGNFYLVVGIGLHSETNEEMVLYKRHNSPAWSEIWARPTAMFEETLKDGRKRFTLIAEDGLCQTGCGRSGPLVRGRCGVCQIIEAQQRGERPLETGE